MPSSPIEILKGRLAQGEITISEYQQILAQLTEGENPRGDKTEKTSQKEVSVRILDIIFGPNSYAAPTDLKPLEVNKRFVIHGSFFEYKGKRLEFEQIISIGAEFDTQTVNLVSSSSSVVTLVLANQEKILLTGMSIVTAGRTNKIVMAAYQILSRITFSNRYQRYVNELKTNDSVVLNAYQLMPFGKVLLTQDGCLVKGGSSVNLRLSAENDCLVIGTSWGSSVQGGVNPSEVVAGERSTSIFSKRVKFTVVFDRDVVFELIRGFAGLN
jgi:hypothetical protein